MSEFEFTFLVSGVDPHADDFADRFFQAGCDDATLMLTRGLIAVSFAREADNYIHAVASAFGNIVKAGATVERFEPDFLVSKSEIANRAGLTKAAVSLYVSGDRGAGFPAPCARVLSSSPLWDWVHVSSWHAEKDLLSHDDVVGARVSRAVNWYVQTRLNPDTPEHKLIDQMRDIAREPMFV